MALITLGVSMPWGAVQSQSRGRAGVGETPISRAETAERAAWPGVAVVAPVPPNSRKNLWLVLASAVVPGSGQALLGVSRSLPYLALETYGWTRYYAHAMDATDKRRAYRNLAAQVARAAFASGRSVGDFAYYERMEKFAESGAFNLSRTDELVPEGDTTTYNGFVWLLARRTYWKNVNQTPDRTSDEWKLAQQFYTRRAYGADFRWSWRGSELEYGEYRQLIGRSNAENRLALQSLGILIANHVLSMVDAYIVVRVRAAHIGGAASRNLEISTTIPLPGGRR